MVQTYLSFCVCSVFVVFYCRSDSAKMSKRPRSQQIGELRWAISSSSREVWLSALVDFPPLSLPIPLVVFPLVLIRPLQMERRVNRGRDETRRRKISTIGTRGGRILMTPPTEISAEKYYEMRVGRVKIITDASDVLSPIPHFSSRSS